MALIKKPYGLIYNTDGSLCYTERPDDTPFSGVTSWAVEEGTTNLADLDFFDWYGQGAGTRELITEGKWAGWYKVVVTHSGNYGFISHLSGVEYNTNDTYSFSIDFYSPTGNIHLEIAGYRSGGDPIKISANRWAGTFTDTNSTTGYEEIFFKTSIGGNCAIDNEVFYYRNYQIEKKPYATSFVDGTRAVGELTIPWKIDAVDVAVVNYWAKNTTKNSNKYLAIGDLANLQNWVWSLGSRYGIIESDKFTIYFSTRKNGTLTSYYYTTDKDLTADFYMITLIYNNTTHDTKVYLNGNVVISQNIVLNYEGGTGKTHIGHYMGSSWGGQTGGAGLFANLFVGNYHDKNGNVIWTDDFIREVYESKAPIMVAK